MYAAESIYVWKRWVGELKKKLRKILLKILGPKLKRWENETI